jgi:hypothetical protein
MSFSRWSTEQCTTVFREEALALARMPKVY